MIRTLDRYLLKSFFANYLLSTAVMMSLYVVLDLFANIDEFTEGGQPPAKVLANIADYYLYNLPLYFAQISGVITLFAACATLARMQRQNEVTAVLASGTSLYRLAAPIIVAAMITNFVLVLDQELLLPSVAAKLARKRDDVEGIRPYEIWCVRDGESRLLSAQQFSPKERRVRGLIIAELSTDPDTRGELTAVVMADKAEWNDERGGWDLVQRGRRISVDQQSAETLADEQPSVPPEPIRFYASTLPPEEILLRKMTQWIQFLSIRQLNQLAARGDADPKEIAEVRHARFTVPIGNMVFLLTGLSFFMTRLPTSVLTQGAKSLAVCSGCFLVAFIGQQAVSAAQIDPALPAWLPIFLFGPLAVVLLENVKT